jgi:FlaA1/EpsC-like NDP-sugar epimerase
MRVVGIVDDSGIPRGRCVHDVPVLGAPKDLDRIVAELAVQGNPAATSGTDPAS